MADSSDSAFERASLPRGIEERLARVDWSVKDVMVGTVRTADQLQFSLDKRGYYVPAKYISDDIYPLGISLCMRKTSAASPELNDLAKC